MTDHEMVLLRAAVEASGGNLFVGPPDDGNGWFAALHPESAYIYFRPTLADALTALLRDLGADVPEWPSEERVAELRGLGRLVFEADLTLPELLTVWQRGGL